MGAGRIGRGTRLFAVGVAATALAAGSYAYTAANTVTDTRAGDGTGDITGYDVTDVDYTLATDPADIDSVSFTLDAEASTVRAKVDASATAYATCAEGTPDRWTCDLSPDTPVVDADELTVIAAE